MAVLLLLCFVGQGKVLALRLDIAEVIITTIKDHMDNGYVCMNGVVALLQISSESTYAHLQL